GGDVARVADRQAVDVGGVAERVHDLERRRLLALQTVRVDRVDQRDRVVDGQLAGQLEAVVERPVDLQQLRAVNQRLGELADRDLALGDEHGAGQAGPGRVGGRRRGRVAGGGADHRLGALGGGHGNRGRHAPVLERSGRVESFYLQVDVAAGTRGKHRRGEQRRAALLEGHGRHPGRDRQPVPVLGDHAAPRRPRASHRPEFRHWLLHHWSPSPSTRITLATARTTGSACSSEIVAARSASLASWVTMMSRASSPRLVCCTAWIETPCRANASATGASTPGLSATSSDTWYLVSVSPIGRTGSSAYVDSSGPRVPAS